MEELSSSKQSRKNEQRRNKRKKDVEYSDKLRKQNCVAMAKKRAADAEFKKARNEASKQSLLWANSGSSSSSSGTTDIDTAAESNFETVLSE